MAINFFEEEIKSSLTERRQVKAWIKQIATNKGFKVNTLNYIFCTDDYLLDINVNYLNHDTFTDIVTFDQSEKDTEIEGDIYISVERVKENAKNLNTSYKEELLRVLAHGLLHLCGYKDKTENEKKEMRNEENISLSLYPPTVPRGTVN
ncbi:rRNA maturation RNase YbeY [Cyclobacterium amurskyense]|uniref:Endoribonuclease YbeY n=1 Tax=Cyclobacterium amurskyense TaxID=320787 RepID=A0A0H4PAB3_9BACT|nr:rRNA maturation RNase YbeY [Cyclobacterium amurskyense]AKP51149.1 Endoribonuclease YbeY [Cyclobacterium amurskyense]|tara:strand:+ start:2680 stop:3126 length:447 start_codon:yes stop_codon:yes gene_type:complete